MSDTVIKVENLSKRYRIGSGDTGYRTFRETIVDAAQAPFLRAKEAWSMVYRARSEKQRAQSTEHGEKAKDAYSLPAPSSLPPADSDTFWALRDVSFEVKRGEVVGIIGRNGAGKSTLLKILSKITEPTTGRVELRGRVGSLLEVGTGFHPELTGHENVYLYGAILGMDRWEITRKFDEIITFAELEKFVDTPVKRYSSGMYMRLAFAVAAHLEPEILLVDEVLAVGDVEFQKKCLGKMEDVAHEGRTVMFVSHNMGAIRNLCTNAILLNMGIIEKKGDVNKIISEYVNYGISDKRSIWINYNETEKKEIAYLEKIEILNIEREAMNSFLSSQSVLINFTLHINEKNSALKVGFDLIKNGDVVFRSQHIDSFKSTGALPLGVNHLFCEIPAFLLTMGDYYIVPLLSIHNVKYLHKERTPILKFKIDLDASVSSFHLPLTEYNHPGLVFPILNWGVK